MGYVCPILQLRFREGVEGHAVDGLGVGVAREDGRARGGLARAEAAWRGGTTAASRIAAAAREALAAEPLVSSVDYVSVADYASMEELDQVPAPGADAAPRAVISVAARVGGVRLIDNLPLR